MKRRIEGVLKEEDRILWAQVARTARPLHPAPPEQKAPTVKQQPAARSSARPGIIAMPAYSPASPPAPVATGHIDRPTVDKLAKGRLPLEARVDLHGMRQDEAYSLLQSFLSRAQARGARHVLVITGKGPGGDGVLKRSVPAWLRTSPFRELVSGLDGAARGHGGEGALYVRLRRVVVGR